jgi:agmatinase
MNATFDPNDATEYDGIFGLPHTPEDSAVVLVPVPFDATTSYRKGAAEGPQTILESSWQVDLRDVETGDPWKRGIAMLPEAEGIVRLNEEAEVLASPIQHQTDEALSPSAIERVNAIGEELTGWVRREVTSWLDRGKLVGVVGGDHASPLGAIEAFAQRYPGLGVLHIDAHADLREAYQGFRHSHASIMHNVLHRADGVKVITQVGVRDLCANEMDVIERDDRVHCFYDSELARARFEGRSFSSLTGEIVASLPQQVYVSFDIDGLDPSLCPNTGTPVPGGLSFQEASYLLGALARSGRRIVGFDLCEVAPGESASIDGIVGARMLYKLIGWSLISST